MSHLCCGKSTNHHFLLIKLTLKYLNYTRRAKYRVCSKTKYLMLPFKIKNSVAPNKARLKCFSGAKCESFAF